MPLPLENKNRIKAVASIAGLIYICFLLQTSVFSRLQLAGITPNLLLVVVTLFGFMKGKKYGIITGFVSGLLLDLFFGSYFGMYALIYMYIGWVNGFLRRVFFGDDLKLPMLLVGASDAVYGIVIYFTMFFLRERYSFGFYAQNVIIPEAVYSVLVTMVLYFPIVRICEWIDKEDKRGTRDLV